MQEWFECFGDVFECQPVVRGNVTTQSEISMEDIRSLGFKRRSDTKEVLWRLSIFAGEPNIHHHNLHPTIKSSLLGLQIKKKLYGMHFPN